MAILLYKWLAEDYSAGFALFFRPGLNLQT